MAQVTKITFSEKEKEAISQQDFFYVKHAAMQKIMELLSETERALREIVLKNQDIKLHTNVESPKIFRGENYRQLPYMVLDYPRKFTTETVFAFRSMFWWGNEFSFTLHLQGEAWIHFKDAILNNAEKLLKNDFYLCVNKSPWQYYFEADNYVPLENIIRENGIAELMNKDFIKFSRKIEISSFDKVPQFAAETLELLLRILR